MIYFKRMKEVKKMTKKEIINMIPKFFLEEFESWIKQGDKQMLEEFPLEVVDFLVKNQKINTLEERGEIITFFEEYQKEKEEI